MGNAWLLADDPICKFADARLPGLAQALEQTSGLISKDSFMLKEMLSWCQVKSRVITCGMPTPRVPILRLPICMAGLSELGPCWVSPPPKKKGGTGSSRLIRVRPEGSSVSSSSFSSLPRDGVKASTGNLEGLGALLAGARFFFWGFQGKPTE